MTTLSKNILEMMIRRLDAQLIELNARITEIEQFLKDLKQDPWFIYNGAEQRIISKVRNGSATE